MKLKKLFFLLTISCFSIFYGYINSNYWLLILIGFSIYFYIIQKKINNKKHTYYISFLFGCLIYGLLYYWIVFPILHFTNSRIITFIAFSLFLIVFGQIPFISIYLASKTGKNKKILIRSILIWGLLEWLQTTSSLFFPWALIGYGMTQSPLAHYAPYGGVFLISTLTLFISFLLCNTYYKINIIKNINIILLILASGYILNKLPKWTNKSSNIKIKWLEPIKLENKWQRKTIDPLLFKGIKTFKNDLIIWPEGELPWVFNYKQKREKKIIKWVKKNNTPILTGSFNIENNKLYNGALLISPDSVQWVYKQKLVPFGEYIPFASILKPLLKNLNIPMSNLDYSKNNHIIKLNNKNLIILICYETAFPNIVWSNSQSGQAIIAITDDHWFKSATAIKEHINMLKMRVLETQKEAAFINQNGYSQIIHLKLNTNYYRNKLFLRTGNTPITIYTDIPIILTLALILLIIYIKEKKDINS